MTLSTLQGHRVTSARATIPAWGAWYCDASVDGEHVLAGAVELKIADLTLKGTVLAGGPAKGRSHFRIVAGGGGWGKTLPAKSYASDAGVKLRRAISEAAQSAGERVDTVTIDASLSTGPAFVRPEGPASRVLELYARGAWYVGEDGITRLGKRAASTLTGPVTHGPVDLARGTVTLASESIAKILPGLSVDGLEAVDVEHEVTPKGLRSTVWGKRSAGGSRRLTALRRIVDQLDPDRKFRGVTEYRVVTLEGKRVNLQPVRVSTGMPDLVRVLASPGLSGSHSMLALGSRVLVGFVDSSPGRPIVLGFEDAEGEGFLPTLTTIDATVIRLGAGVKPIAAAGDLAGGIWPIVPTQFKALV